MFDPATMAMLLKVGLPIAMQAFSALGNKGGGMTGVRAKTDGGGGIASGLAQAAVPVASAAMTGGSLPTMGLTAPATNAAAGGGMMSALGSIGSAMGGGGGAGGGMGSALGSMLAGGFGGGGGSEPMSSTTTSSSKGTEMPWFSGEGRDKWLGAVGINRAQQQERNQLVTGLPMFARDMLGNFMSGTPWGRSLGGGMAGYQPRDPFAQIDPYPLAEYSKDYNGANADEIAKYGEAQPGTHMPQSAAWDQYYANRKPEGKAFGGPILKTKKYTVGEQGPETYLPPMGGQMRTLGGQGQTVNTLQRGGYVVPNPQTMLRTTAPVRPGLGASGNEKGAQNPTLNSLVPNPQQMAGQNPLAGQGGGLLPDPITRNAFSPALIQQMTARGIEGANMQTRNRNALYAGQMNAAGLTGPNIGAVLSQPSSMDAMRAGAQTATDTNLAGMSMGLNQQQAGNAYNLQLLQMLLNGMFGSEYALQPAGRKYKNESESTTETE